MAQKGAKKKPSKKDHARLSAMKALLETLRGGAVRRTALPKKLPEGSVSARK